VPNGYNKTIEVMKLDGTIEVMKTHNEAMEATKPITLALYAPCVTALMKTWPHENAASVLETSGSANNVL